MAPTFSPVSRALNRRRGQTLFRRRGGNVFIKTGTALLLLSLVLFAVAIFSTSSVHRLLEDSAPSRGGLGADTGPSDANGRESLSPSEKGGRNSTSHLSPAGNFYANWNNTLFTPHIFSKGRATGKWRDGYVNLPINVFTSESEQRVEDAIAKSPGEPYGMMHEAHPPGKDVVMGLAAYPRNILTFRRLVGGLRNVGYAGHIILGVHAQIPKSEQEYLKRQDATFYAVDMIECDASMKGDGKGGNIRGKCSRGLEDLTLEWGRFEMARQWLNKCANCTGWALVCDTRDIFFQTHPFKSLPDPATAKKDLLFIEEISHHTSPRPPEENYRYHIMDNGRYKGRTGPCYGKNHWTQYVDRPVLCSGTIIGTRSGMHRFLSVLVDEFRANNKKANEKCRSPHNTDQWTMNYMYYHGRFGYPDRTATLPWGTGPIMTIGHACINNRLKPSHSQKDLIVFEGGDSAGGWILNNWEEEGSAARKAAAVHQYDRCHKWIQPWFWKHTEQYSTERAPLWKS